MNCPIELKRILKVEDLKKNLEYLIGGSDDEFSTYPGIYKVISTCSFGEENGVALQEKHSTQSPIILLIPSELNTTLFVWEII